MHWTAWATERISAEQQEVYLLVMGQGAEGEPRAPVVVNLLLDRSGSMKGAPLAAAVEAAQQFVELARPDDFMGLLVFDGVAEQRVPMCAMDARGKRQMSDALRGIQAGRGTALHQAIELAARSLQRILVPGRRSRLLLLTDGEPSVGQDTQQSFDELGLRLARENVSVHALGLARHYVAEVLAALTQPSGNAFEHVDGPDGLSEAMGAVVAHVFGHVATDATVRVQPEGFLAMACRHGYPTRVEQQAIVVALGDISQGYARRVLFSGAVPSAPWTATLQGSCKENGDLRQQRIEVETVAADSARGRLVLAVSHELELVTAETAAWLSLARKDLERAETQLEEAEVHARSVMELAAEGIPAQRHLDRLADLRLAVERGEGDIPLLIRRAQSARAGTHVSQVIPLQAYRDRKP